MASRAVPPELLEAPPVAIPFEGHAFVGDGEILQAFAVAFVGAADLGVGCGRAVVACQHPGFGVLSREGCGAPANTSLEVSNEHTFSVVVPDDSGEEQLWSGSIDRLLLARLADDFVWAEVLDYKTDILTEDLLPDRIEYYRPQLEIYGRVVAAQTGLTASEIRLRLVFLELGRVVEIVPPSE